MILWLETSYCLIVAFVNCPKLFIIYKLQPFTLPRQWCWVSSVYIVRDAWKSWIASHLTMNRPHPLVHGTISFNLCSSLLYVGYGRAQNCKSLQNPWHLCSFTFDWCRAENCLLYFKACVMPFCLLSIIFGTITVIFKNRPCFTLAPWQISSCQKGVQSHGLEKAFIF